MSCKETTACHGKWSSSDGHLRRQLEDKLGVHEIGNHNEVAVAESTKAFLCPTGASDKAPEKRMARSLSWTPQKSAQFIQILLHSANNIMMKPPRLYPAAKQLDDRV